MASYTAEAGEVGIYGRTLAAGVEDIVTMTQRPALEVRYWPGSGTEPIYVRFGAVAAAAPATDGSSPCIEILPGESVRFSDPADKQVRLFCAGVAKYSVAEA